MHRTRQRAPTPLPPIVELLGKIGQALQDEPELKFIATTECCHSEGRVVAINNQDIKATG